ncbi:hypothetical protein HDF24_04600 [Mucilaginibacter sp. X4EP1]|jgi:uncharacterized membrane protein YkgB|uniref:hypothetical protein n=1 Tax=Mucilaginibacter sp. X4EP1 TaxID=2723092 RepID=UPI0021692121|nr:hypothetical protein [Mucilaginibacter sp. X4EP1]MCS3816272.1 putative membrane protein YkgB [Mucilaginibacter sp. X4EP1]
MIKISKGYLFILSRVGPLVVIFIHIAVISILIKMGLWTVCCSYAAFALFHFFTFTIWKRFLLSDVYVNGESDKVIFKKLTDTEETFNRKQVIKLSTYAGITKVIISADNREIKKYFMANDEDSINYLAKGAQSTEDKLPDQENISDII